jgi:alpha,alpha-trehalase
MNDRNAATHGAAGEEQIAYLPAADTLTPADRYQELFVAVQTQRVFVDSKTFVDCAPRYEPKDILEAYRAGRDQPAFQLAAFVKQNFQMPGARDSHYVSQPGQLLKDHIDGLWPVLTRQPELHPPASSLLPLPHVYVVPGGRFGEMYYWDSYFTMLGLAGSGRHDLLQSMAANFAFQIDAYGHIPNGNRTYYLSRSQPPVFALMVELFEEHGVAEEIHYLPQLLKEHAYWMDGAGDLRPGEDRRCVVRHESGALLCRYWDDRDTPREESYLEDVTTAARSLRPRHETYRELRAAAASGWDFSSRWLADPADLSSIRTTAILPVDLNCFVYKLETSIARLSAAKGDAATSARFSGLAAARRQAIASLMWSEKDGSFLDYDWELGTQRPLPNAAAVTPLFVGLATREQAGKLANTIRQRMLQQGGMSTTLVCNGEQWDRPNGWAPLQWMACLGLTAYGESALADDIAGRWLATVERLYRRESKLVEKYALDDASGGGGGEYPLQDGFGWTNGVTRRMLDLYPHHPCHRAPADGSRQISAASFQKN